MDTPPRKDSDQIDEDAEIDEACLSCGEPLGLKGGMGGTGLCGPCCTGEAATLDEFGETW